MESRKEIPPRRPRKPRMPNAFSSTLGIAVLLATLFTAWTPTSFFASNLEEQMRLILTPQTGPNVVTTPQPQLRIGIVAGHTGNDSGAVCFDENGQPGFLVCQSLASGSVE